jgi:signal transduction histidine kinase/CheY-like chemotaxis protein
MLKPLKMSVILPVLSQRAHAWPASARERPRSNSSVRARTAELEARAARMSNHQAAERLKAEQALMQAQKIEAIGRLTGGVAHNFNNLLMAIDGALQLLDKRLDPEHAGRKYIDCARQAAERGAKVTGELLAFSRTQRFDLRSTEIRRALQAGQSIFAQAVGPTIRFSLELGDDDVWAMTDPDQLELAIVNLAINARDALPDGGDITLGLTTEHAAAPVVAVWLRDTGIGMSSEVAARALEPFFTTKERGKGSGLGLAQVYGFARQCGGEVRIDSAPGAGTTITVMLPRAAPPAVEEPPPEAVAPRIPEPATRAEGFRLLVVDDDDAVRQILVDGLRLEGFEVAEAADGETGLQALRREPPHALVVDYAMPGMNGAEVAKQARALRPGLPVVFCSGYADTLALDDIEDAPLMRKPVAVSALGRMVVDLIARQAD